MKKNFTIVDYVAIEFQGVYLDIHNNYELLSVCYDRSISKATIIWAPFDNNNGDLKSLSLYFLDVSAFHCNLSDKEDGSVLRFAGYVSDDEFGVTSDSFIPEEEAVNEKAIIFSFEDKSSISVKCTEVILSEID